MFKSKMPRPKGSKINFLFLYTPHISPKNIFLSDQISVGTPYSDSTGFFSHGNSV